LLAVLVPGDVITPFGTARGWKDRSRPSGHPGAWAIKGEVPSPSFAIVQPYEELDPPVWHVDLYRIEDAGEIDELGLDSLGRGGSHRRMARARRVNGTWPEALQITLDFGKAALGA
jgi:tRNA threonylcarbamoyladenosine biosynthesis protein TsaE